MWTEEVITIKVTAGLEMKSAKKGRKQGRERHLDEQFFSLYEFEDCRGVR